MPRLAIFLFGPFQVTLDGAPVTDFKTNKGQALLAYLAVEADRAHERESLTGLLWPEQPEEAARVNLRFLAPSAPGGMTREFLRIPVTQV